MLLVYYMRGVGWLVSIMAFGCFLYARVPDMVRKSEVCLVRLVL